MNHCRSSGNAVSCLAEHVCFNQQLTQQTHPTGWASSAGYECVGSTHYSLKPSSILSVTQTGCNQSHWIKYGGWYETSHWQMRQIMENKPPLVITAWFYYQCFQRKTIACSYWHGLEIFLYRIKYSCIDDVKQLKQLELLDLISQTGIVTLWRKLKFESISPV